MTTELAAPTGAPVAPPVGAAEHSMRRLIDHVVDRVPGVLAAVVSSNDGFVLAHRLHASAGSDAAAVAAMSAAVLALSNRMVQLTGRAPIGSCHQRSSDGQVFVFAIGEVAVLTILATSGADPLQIGAVGRELTLGLVRAIDVG